MLLQRTVQTSFLVLFLNINTTLVIARENSGTNNKQRQSHIYIFTICFIFIS